MSIVRDGCARWLSYGMAVSRHFYHAGNNARRPPIGSKRPLPEERTLDRVPTFEADAGLTRKTRKAIDVFLKTSRAQHWIQHDFTASAALKKGPAFYD